MTASEARQFETETPPQLRCSSVGKLLLRFGPNSKVLRMAVVAVPSQVNRAASALLDGKRPSGGLGLATMLEPLGSNLRDCGWRIVSFKDSIIRHA